MTTTIRIRALRNFGHLGRNVPKGAVIDVTIEDFGGTYEEFKRAGLFVEAERGGRAFGRLRSADPRPASDVRFRRD